MTNRLAIPPQALRASETSAPRSSPWLVSVDGPSGIGKSTVISVVQAQLSKVGLACELVATHRSGPHSSLIQTLAKDSSTTCSLALALASARAYIMETRPAQLLISDRYVISSLVYQGYAGLASEFIYMLNSPVLDGVISFVLELPQHTLLTRREQRARVATDWFKESMPLELEIELFNTARDELRKRGRTVISIHADGTPEGVAEHIVTRLLPHFAE